MKETMQSLSYVREKRTKVILEEFPLDISSLANGW